jgi:uncharacterized damage-inducible protein DinB
MFRLIDDFLEDWAQESESTLKIMNSLTDSSLKQATGPDGRSLGDIAWHIAFSLGEMPATAGLPVPMPEEDAPTPFSVAEIVQAYEENAAALNGAVEENWDDDSLDEEVEAYGETFTKGAILTMLLKHEIHHRAQMTILMRLAGLRVPGVYGPSKEEWAEYGMPPKK